MSKLVAHAMQICSEEVPYADLDLKIIINDIMYCIEAQYHPEYKDNEPTGRRFLIAKMYEY